MANVAKIIAVDEVPSIHRDKEASVSGPLIDSFLESGAKAARVEREKDIKATATRATIKRYLEVRKITNVDVVTREGNVYLIRTDTEDTDEGSTNG